MSIVKMKRLKLLGLLEERDAVLSRLQQLGCVEITETAEKLADPEYAALLHRDVTALSDYRNINTKLSATLEILKKHAPVKTGLFLKRQDISRGDLFSESLWSETLDVVEKIGALDAHINKAYAEKSKLSATQESLAPWATCDIPLDTAGTTDAAVLFAGIPAAASFEEMEAKLYEEGDPIELFKVSSDRDQHYFVVICHRTVLAKATDIMRPYGYTVPSFKDLQGTAAENIAAIDKDIAEIDADIAESAEKIKSFAYIRHDLQLCLDRSTQDMMRETAKERLLATDRIFALEGWAATTKLDELETMFSEFSCAWDLTDPEEGDTVPTLLKNPKWMRCINMVTEMYSLPAYNGIDPNPLIFFTYVFFFGFMFADVGYGLIILLVSHLVIKLYNPKNTMGYMFHLGRYLGFSTAVCGLLIGGFFGDVITVFPENFMGLTVDQLPAWIQNFSNGFVMNPLNQPMTVLIVAVVIGVIQLLFGQLVHIYMGFRDGCALDYILDVVPWWILFGGIAGTFFTGSILWLIIGVLVMILTQGRHSPTLFGKFFGGLKSLYDITSWLSDVLSYCRLMALMLATSVIASVVNILGSMPGSIIAFVIVFLVGHVFNIGVNLIGTYVHAARLHYLEFFGKFYKEGGIPFKPLNYNTKYVDILEEEK